MPVNSQKIVWLGALVAEHYHAGLASLRAWQTRRGDRVADCAGLEIQCGSNITVGSNPTLSAHIALK